MPNLTQTRCGPTRMRTISTAPHRPAPPRTAPLADPKITLNCTVPRRTRRTLLGSRTGRHGFLSNCKHARLPRRCNL
eukprot:1315295-Amorphochlora_amoeboformis.AAC.2